MIVYIILIFVYCLAGAVTFYACREVYTDTACYDNWVIWLIRKYVSKPVVFVLGFALWWIVWIIFISCFILYMIYDGLRWAFNIKFDWLYNLLIDGKLLGLKTCFDSHLNDITDNIKLFANDPANQEQILYHLRRIKNLMSTLTTYDAEVSKTITSHLKTVTEILEKDSQEMLNNISKDDTK